MDQSRWWDASDEDIIQQAHKYRSDEAAKERRENAAHERWKKRHPKEAAHLTRLVDLCVKELTNNGLKSHV